MLEKFIGVLPNPERDARPIETVTDLEKLRRYEDLAVAAGLIGVEERTTLPISVVKPISPPGNPAA